MRYFTEQMYHSASFYGFFFKEMNVSFYELSKEWMESLREDEDFYNGMDTIKDLYKLHIRQMFNNKIYNCSKIKEIIFDKNGEIIELDENIYNRFYPLQIEYEDLENRMLDIVEEKADFIRNGEYPACIKKLAALDKHEAVLVFINLSSFSLNIIFKLYGNGEDEYIYEKYCFRIINRDDCKDIEKYQGYDIVNEELIALEDGIFEYNILMNPPNTLKEVKEVSIQFHSLEIEIVSKEEIS